MKYVTVESARRTCGIGADVINDADVEAIIDECEPQVERFYNTSFTPTEIIETSNGSDTSILVLKKNPVLAIRDIYIDGTQLDPSYLDIYRGSGKIHLSTNSPEQTFVLKPNSIVTKYIYGYLEEGSKTSTSAAIVSGTSVDIVVLSADGFAQDDWIEIYGMDGHREAAKITTISGTTFTLDQITKTHVAGSVVVKLQVMKVFEKLMNYAVSISMVARIVGQSYTDTTGYGLGELHVQKGEPYTQWRETANQLIKERDRLMARMKTRPAIM